DIIIAANWAGNGEFAGGSYGRHGSVGRTLSSAQGVIANELGARVKVADRSVRSTHPRFSLARRLLRRGWWPWPALLRRGFWWTAGCRARPRRRASAAR